MNVGDLVQAVYPFVLACGSGRYDFAVVVQVDPLVLVSEQGDMLWRATLYDGCVRSVGRAHQDSFVRSQTGEAVDEVERGAPSGAAMNLLHHAIRKAEGA